MLWIWNVVTHETTLLTKDQPLVPEFFSADSKTLFARAIRPTNGILPLVRWDLAAPTNLPKIAMLDVRNAEMFASGAVSPDGRIYALGQSGARVIMLWDPFTGQSTGSLSDQWLGTWFLRFSPDGRKLASDVHISDFTTRNKVKRIHPPAKVWQLTFSPDSQLLALACADHTIRLRDTLTGKELAILTGHQQGVSHLAFSPDGNTLVSSDDGNVKLWSVVARREVATVIRNLAHIRFLAFTPDGNTLLVGTASGTVHLWRVPPLAEIDREAAWR
jgi:WD40 repeat protein